jgi:hypothetical protein
LLRYKVYFTGTFGDAIPNIGKERQTTSPFAVFFVRPAVKKGSFGGQRKEKDESLGQRQRSILSA